MQFHIPLLLLIVTISNSSGSRIGSSSAAAINTVNADNTDEFPHIPTESRIVGGYDAEIGSYPFFVSWGGCGASLIEKDILLTAAHCIGVATNQVYIGQSRKFGTAGTGVRRTIIQRVPHPNYNDRTVNYDYMLLKLNSPVNTTEYPPIQLNNNGAVPMNEQILTVIGFGAQNQGSTATPSRLQEVDVNYISTNTCNNPSSYSGQVQGETMFCAGIEGEGGRDACQGDSGGPIFYEKEDGIFEQVGIVSWGRGCAQRRYPGIYSRISGVIDWIQTEVCDLLDSESVVFNCGGNGSSNGGGGGEMEEEEVVDINLPEEPLTPILPAPPATTVPIRLDITYDERGNEVGWKFEQNGQIVLSKNNGADISSQQQSYRVNLIPDIEATFTMTDTGSDGICCSYGIVSYDIWAETFIGDMPLVISSEGYQDEDVQVFTVPYLGFDNPFGEDIDDDNNDSGYPLFPPTAISSPSPEPAPTTIIMPPSFPPPDNNNNEGEEVVVVRLDIKYDSYASEVGWSFEQVGETVLSKNAGEISAPPFDQSYRVNMTPGIDAKFTITDASGDGICCSYGKGKYEIFVETPSEDISLYISDGTYAYKEEVQLAIPIKSIKDENDPSPSSGPEEEVENVEDPTTTNPPIPSLSVAPEENDNEPIDCVDSSVEFYVDNNAGNRSCDWLSDNMDRYGYLCAFFDITLKCRRLCNTCEYFNS
mmetsp:Transcript_41933/g.47654  ORF Transcript_41933/g.47654 Transcript_41933/m.47654 type:complete len:704 (-) Transcript_41933:39-2150(-)